MRSSRGIKVTILLASLVLLVFAGFTLIAPDPTQEDTPTSVSTSATNTTLNGTPADDHFVQVLRSVQENVSVQVSKIRSAGMNYDLATVQGMDQELLQMIDEANASVNNISVSSDLQQAKAELLAALEDYRSASTYGAEGAASRDMNTIATAMEYFQKANSHMDNAVASV